MSSAAPSSRPWWETRPFVALLILIAAVPLLYPPIPPLVDLFGHMGRYRVQLDLATSPWLQQYYGFRWEPIGNLGVDLLLEPVGRILGLELAVKLIVLAIPPMTVAGFLWVAREVHGRIPPTALFALPFAYGHPFMFGFVNFALSMALAFLAFGLWLRLARIGRVKLRAILFVPISVIVFFAHTFGWGALGLMCFSAEAVRQHDRGAPWLKSGLKAAMHASVMALPLLFVLAWRSEAQGVMTRDWFHWKMKFDWLLMALRDRWKWFDIAALFVVLAIILEALRNPRLGFSRNLAFSALVLLAGFIILPRIIFESAYADMRLVPYLFAMVLLAIRFRGTTHLATARSLAILGMAFLLVRIGGNTASMAIASRDQQAKLAALEHVPEGATVASLVGFGCDKEWPMPRNSHLGGMAIVRRHAFSNEQWRISGTNLLRVHYPPAGVFQADPSQLVVSNDCRRRRRTVDQALQMLPREAFDYLWLIDVPPYDPALLDGLALVWRGPRSELYRINRAAAKAPPATPRTASAPGR